MVNNDAIRAAALDVAGAAGALARQAGALSLQAADLVTLLGQVDPPIPGTVTMKVTEATSSSVTVAWETDRADVAKWTIGRDKTDTKGTAAWSTTLPGTADHLTFGSLHPATAYTIALVPDGGSVVTIVASTIPEPPGPPPLPTGSGQHGPRAVADGWVPMEVHRDDFTGPLDPDRWSPYDSVGHGGKGLRRPGQFSFVDDPTALGGRALRVDGTAEGTTGGMANKRAQRFGRWAARMKVPSGDPRWHPVLLTWPHAENWSKGGGEIDYAEGKCGANRMQFFLHYSSSGGLSTEQTTGALDVDVTQWHWYEMEWCRTGVRGWCDGMLFFTDTNQAHFNYGAFGAMHGTIQLDWFPESAKTTGPGVMLVDAYRVYRHPDTMPG